MIIATNATKSICLQCKQKSGRNKLITSLKHSLFDIILHRMRQSRSADNGNKKVGEMTSERVTKFPRDEDIM